MEIAFKGCSENVFECVRCLEGKLCNTSFSSVHVLLLSCVF